MSQPYDPQACGALCSACPLKGKTVVPPQEVSLTAQLSGQAIAVVGEAPGEQEERQKIPFVGPSGEVLDKALQSAAIRRTNVHVTNTLLCRPPGNKLSEFLRKINAANKENERQAKKEGRPPPVPVPSPIDCCKPRLEAELRMFTKFITLGTVATQAVTGSRASIMSVRGSFITLEATDVTPHRGVMPTVHPAFVLRQQRWLHVFRSDLHKAGRAFRGAVEWKPPIVHYHPTAEFLRAFLARTDILYTYDLETDGIESLTAKIRCVGIGTADEVVVCGFLGKDGQRKFYTPQEELEVKQVLCEFFADPNRTKVGHNSGYYDRVVLEQQWGVTPTPNIDTILLHRNVESELPHSLAYVASMYTDAPPWKHDREGNKLSSAAETDEQLHEYNALDVAVTARVVSPLIAAVQMRDQVGVWQIDQKMQDVCAGMHTVGMYVDQEKRLKTEKEMFKRRHDLLAQIRAALGRPGFNPSSVQQLRALLFEEWKLVPPLDAEDALTSSGDPSTADLVLRALLTDRSIPKHQRDLIKLVRYFRKVQKVLGTYVVKMRPETDVIEDDAVDPNDFELQTLGWDEDEDWVDKETRKKYGLAKRGIVYANTGRMHPGYNAQVAVTGRLSSSKPINAQNYPKSMRGLVVAAPGHVFVGADMDQLELRIAAARWRVQLYLKAFMDGKDPHSMTAYAVFGDAFLKAAGLTADQFIYPGPLVGTSYVNGKFEGTGEDKKMRDLSKAVQYASQYMATVETVHQLITKTEVPAKDEHGNVREDGTTELPYALMPLSKVREMRDNWLKGAPEFEKGWEQEIQAYRRQGYLREPVTGRRRDFLDGEAPNEIVNFPIQSSAAGLMNLALIQLREQIPTHFWGPGTGIVNQCHDSIMVECPADGVELRPVFDAEGKLVLDKKGQPKTKVYVPEGCIAAQVAKQLEACMNQTHPDLPGVTFTATASIGFSWKDV